MRIRIVVSCALMLAAELARGQGTSPVAGSGSATVSGVVRDSLSRSPLADAMVQLIAADNPTRFGRVAISDSLGRYSIAGIPDGVYNLGFFHPRLDTLGVEPPALQVRVANGNAVRADLAIPSPDRLREVICGSRSARDAGALVIGTVRDAGDGSPAAGATVVGEWLELTYTPRNRNVTRRVPRVVAKTEAGGWFALCGLPRAGSISLTAHRGSDSTDLIELDVPAEQVLRRDLFLGGASASTGRLAGTVVAVAGGKPLSGAEVSISGGSRTRANERGEWTLSAAPIGTRMLDIRALGYYPVHRPVDIVEGAEPVHVKLYTLAAVLDTVKVATSQLRLHASGFEERRRSGMGHYLTAADVAKHRPIVTSDLIRFVQGVEVVAKSSVERSFKMRGAFSDGCTPEVYINNHFMADIGPDEVDSWVNPNELDGIEIYSEGTVPPQFHRSLTECGAIVIWTHGW